MEYIIVKNGIIIAHQCGKDKPENAIQVPDGFAGYIGLPFAALKDDLSGLKSLSRQIAEGVVEMPEGYKINKADNEFVRMEQAEIDEKYPVKTYAAEGSFDAIEVKKMFDKDGHFGYWPPSGTVEMSGKQPGPAYKAVSGQWVLDAEKEAQIALSQAKTERASSVEAITVEVDGMIFDGDEKAQDRMTRAVTMFQASDLPEDYKTAWVLADSTVAKVTVSQLSRALLLAGQKQTELWVKPYTGVNAQHL